MKITSKALEGAIEPSVGDKPVLTREMVDYPDQLWAYLIEPAHRQSCLRIAFAETPTTRVAEAPPARYVATQVPQCGPRAASNGAGTGSHGARIGRAARCLAPVVRLHQVQCVDLDRVGRRSRVGTARAGACRTPPDHRRRRNKRTGLGSHPASSRRRCPCRQRRGRSGGLESSSRSRRPRTSSFQRRPEPGTGRQPWAAPHDPGGLP